MTQKQSDGGIAVDLGRQLADTAERAASKLDDGGVDAVMSDLKRFARRRPAVFLAGALGAGFVAGRLLKAADTHSLMQAVTHGDGGQPDAVGAPSQLTRPVPLGGAARPAGASVSVDLTSELS